MATDLKLAATLFVFFAMIAAVFAVAVSPFISHAPAAEDIRALTSAPPQPKLETLGAANFLVSYPQDAPPDIRPMAVLGFGIVNETHKYAQAYIGNKLSCGNCHFRGGMTEGGRNGGVPLVGVASRYPTLDKKTGSVIDLAERVNQCFRQELAGTGLPAGSREQLAVITYLHWIGRGIPVYAEVKWLRPGTLPVSRAPDVAAGGRVFGTICSACHGPDGQGSLIAPPVWGPDSFTAAAGMNRLSNLAPFLYYNMPRGNPSLTPSQALDAAGFVSTRPRPAGTP